jgi:hypothetical protein
VAPVVADGRGAGAEDRAEVRGVLERGVEVDEVGDADGEDRLGFAERHAGGGRRVGRGMLHGLPGVRAELDERVEVGRAGGVLEAGVRREREVGQQQDVVAVAQRRPRRAAAAEEAHDAVGQQGRAAGRVVWQRRHRRTQLTRMVARSHAHAVGVGGGRGAGWGWRRSTR